MDPIERIAEKHSIAPAGVRAVVALLKEGGTVPFIARYRKEATGGLDEVQIRAIEEDHGYFTELLARKKTVLEEIERQGKITHTAPRPTAGVGTKNRRGGPSL